MPIYRITFEMDVDGPVPPDPPSDLGSPYVIVGMHRAYRDTDTPITAWVRTEAGRMDLSGAEAIEVAIERRGHELLRVDATGSELGRLDFTIPAPIPQRHVPGEGVFVLKAYADGRLVYTAHLEVV